MVNLIVLFAVGAIVFLLLTTSQYITPDANQTNQTIIPVGEEEVPTEGFPWFIFIMGLAIGYIINIGHKYVVESPYFRTREEAENAFMREVRKKWSRVDLVQSVPSVDAKSLIGWFMIEDVGKYHGQYVPFELTKKYGLKYDLTKAAPRPSGELEEKIEKKWVPPYYWPPYTKGKRKKWLPW